MQVRRHPDLNNTLDMLKTQVYEKTGFTIDNLKFDAESAAYGACTFECNGANIIHRIAKVTPTKVGQFVAIWKRSQNGTTMPFDVADRFDFFVITTKYDHHFGQFVFPKEVLANKGIVAQNGKGGKRGIRVYPPWDKVTNKQAEVSQRWQSNFFISIKNDQTMDLVLTKQLYDLPNTIKAFKDDVKCSSFEGLIHKQRHL